MAVDCGVPSAPPLSGKNTTPGSNCFDCAPVSKHTTTLDIKPTGHNNVRSREEDEGEMQMDSYSEERGFWDLLMQGDGMRCFLACGPVKACIYIAIIWTGKYVCYFERIR